MRRLTPWALLMLLAACDARISGAPGDPGFIIDAAPGEDDAAATPIDAGATDAGTLGPWSAPAKIPQASTGGSEDDATLTSNALEMVFAIDDPAGKNGKDLYYSSRPSAAAAWTTAVKLPFNSTTQSDETPRFSADDKTLFFASGRTTNSNGKLDIYTVTHPAPGSANWGTPAQLTTPAVNTGTLTEKWYMPCGTHYILVQDTTNNGTDLFEGSPGNPLTAIATLNSTQNETGTFVTPDCLTIYFASARGTFTKIYKSTRQAATMPWLPPTAVVDFPIAAGNGNQEDPWMSPDGRTFVFASDSSGTKDVYISTR